MFKKDALLVSKNAENFPLLQNLSDSNLLKPILEKLELLDLYKLTMVSKHFKNEIKKTDQFKEDRLKELKFSKLSGQQVTDAFKVISNCDITELSFDTCPMNKKACKNLASIIKAKQLVKLDLSNCAINSQDIKIIIDAVKCNTTIKHLMLDNINLYSSKIRCMQDMNMANNLSNRYCFNLSSFFINSFTKNNYNPIAELLAVNCTLTSISVKNNNINIDDAYHIYQALEINSKSHLQELNFYSVSDTEQAKYNRKFYEQETNRIVYEGSSMGKSGDLLLKNIQFILDKNAQKDSANNENKKNHP